MRVDTIRRFVVAIALLAAPVFWGAGLLFRYLAYQTAPFSAAERLRFAGQPFAAPGQLAAYVERSTLYTTGMALFLFGVVLLFPAIAMLVSLVAVKAPRLAYFAGALFFLGLISRVYFAGADQTALSLTAAQNVDQLSTAVLDAYVEISYGPWRLPVTAAFGWYLGALLLAIGAYRTELFGVGRTLLFLWPCTLWIGVLKEADLADALSAVALWAVVGPLGIRLLLNRSTERATKLW